MAWGRRSTLVDRPQPFTSEEIVQIQMGMGSFTSFLDGIFPKSFLAQTFPMADGTRHEFELSNIHYLWGKIVEKETRACLIAPRMHLKSTICNHAFSFWQGFKSCAFVDGMVYSYTQDLAEDHTEILKRDIKNNPFCRFWIDNNPAAKSRIDFTVSFGPQLSHLGRWQFKVEPAGVFAAQRGKHPRFVVCDDILSDFANPLDQKVLKRIDDIFNSVIQSLPGPDDPLIVVGTPQSYDDTLYRLRSNTEFWWGRFPAEITEEGTKADGDPRVAWPERFSYRVLKRVLKRVMMRAYQVEYLLIPFLAVNSRLPRESVVACVDPSLKGCELDEPFDNPENLPTFGGMDIGKMIHPTHVVVFMKMHDGSLVQVYQKFLDHMPYNAQAKLVNRVIDHFNISRFYYDSTRAELDDRQVSRRARGKPFSRQLKANIALLLERRVYADQEEPTIIWLPDNRQVNQIVAVTMDLKSVETDEGHGDSFWSNALAVKAAEDGAGTVVLGDVGAMFAQQGQQATRRRPPTPVLPKVT